MSFLLKKVFRRKWLLTQASTFGILSHRFETWNAVYRIAGSTAKNWRQPQYPLIGDVEINAGTGEENEQGRPALTEPFPGKPENTNPPPNQGTKE